MWNKIETKDSVFKVGDILVGTGGYNMTYTKWYKVKRMTKHKVVLDELPVSYPTKYGPNTPGDICMPVIDGVLYESCPYYFGARGLDVDTSGFVWRSERKDYVKLPGDYGMLLSLWDGQPGWVNFD